MDSAKLYFLSPELISSRIPNGCYGLCENPHYVPSNVLKCVLSPTVKQTNKKQPNSTKNNSNKIKSPPPPEKNKKQKPQTKPQEKKKIKNRKTKPNKTNILWQCAVQPFKFRHIHQHHNKKDLMGPKGGRRLGILLCRCSQCAPELLAVSSRDTHMSAPPCPQTTTCSLVWSTQSSTDRRKRFAGLSRRGTLMQGSGMP